MHYTLILSPKGQQLLTLIDHAHKLIPYTIIRQTLKIGNVASMINGMMKIVLAKMSVASVTNWMGLTKTEDDGQNLLQHVISQTLQWDIRDFKSRATKIEKEKDGPKKEQLDKIKAYLQKSREEHEGLREMSRKSKSTVHSLHLSINHSWAFRTREEIYCFHYSLRRPGFYATDYRSTPPCAGISGNPPCSS